MGTSEEPLRSFAADMEINRYKLEEECERHSALYYYWAEKLAEAKIARDAAEDHLKTQLAMVEMEIRRQAEASGAKTTEASVKAQVETSPQILAAKEAVRKATGDLYKLEAGVRAFDHRKNELDNLVQLWIKSYYSRPDGGPDQASKTLRQKLNQGGGESNG